MNNLISQIENYSNISPNSTAIYRRIIYKTKQTPFIYKISAYYMLILGFLVIMFVNHDIFKVTYLLIIFFFLLGLFFIIKTIQNNDDDDDDDDLEWEAISYKNLNNDINNISKKLILGGIKPRQVIWLLWAPEKKYDLIIMILALIKIGAIISWSSPEQIGGLINFFKKIEEISPELIIGTPLILNIVKFIQLISFGKALRSITFFYPHYKIYSNEKELEKAAYDTFIVETFPAKMSDVVIIGFTTGSTGNPKGVQITFGMLLSQAISWLKIIENTKVGNNSSIVTLHHAINFIFLDLAVGISSVLPEGNILDQDSIDINIVMNIVQKFKVDILSGSPILIKKIYFIPSCVDKIFSYGCELHLNLFDKIKRSFNNNNGKGRLLSMYGATEGGPISIFDGNYITDYIRQKYRDGYGICLGKTDSTIIEVCIKVPKYNGDDDDKSKFSFINCKNNDNFFNIKGEICITGPGSSIKCTSDEDTHSTKITESSSRKIYHRTGDYGYYDIYGNLWSLGRIAHSIETKWGVVYPLQVESAVNTLQMPEVFSTALVGIPANKGNNLKCLYLVFRLFPNILNLYEETIFWWQAWI